MPVLHFSLKRSCKKSKSDIIFGNIVDGTIVDRILQVLNRCFEILPYKFG